MGDGDRTAATTAAVPALLLGLVVALFRQGGLAPGGTPALAAGVLVAAAVTLVRRRPRGRRVPGVRTGAVALAALVTWIVADSAGQDAPGRALPWAATAAGVALVLWTGYRLRGPDRSTLRDGLLLIGVLLAGATWGAAVLRLPGWSATGRGLWRADGPLTYANATAAALVMLALVAVSAVPGPDGEGWAGDVRPSGDGEATWSPRTSLAAGVLLVAACAATVSRGGALALAVGAAVTALLTDRHGRRALTAVITGGVIAAAGLLPGLPASSARGPVTAIAATAALAVGILVALALARRPLPDPSRHRSSPATRTTTLAVIVLAAGLLAAGSAVASSGLLASRLTLDSSHRVPAAAAALRTWSERPWTGIGPTRSSVTWRGPDGASLTLAYLHDEYLQVLYQFGVPALVLLLAAIVTLAVALHACRPAPAGGPARREWAAAAGAFAAFAVHSGLDWLAHLPVLPLLCAAVVGLGLTASSDRDPESAAPPGAAKHPQREDISP